MPKIKTAHNEAYNKRTKFPPFIKGRTDAVKYDGRGYRLKDIAAYPAVKPYPYVRVMDLPQNEIRSDKNYKLFIKALKQLSTIAELDDDWNDNGAKHFESGLLVKCFLLLMELENFPPEVFPVADNSIQMEYDCDNDSYLQFRVYDDSIRVFGILSNGQKIKYNTTDSSQIVKEVNMFRERCQK